MTTPLTDEARSQLIEHALSAATADVARWPIKWRGGEAVLPVVQIDVDAVLLNPHSHRIRSLLESQPDRGSAILDNPFTGTSQTDIAKLLRSTDGFPQIKNALARDGQQSPGVLTRAGVLVNANTRAVALRDLHQGHGPAYVKVVVLPADATEKEITLLELELQMERDVKQEYSFTARLLFIEELMTKLTMSTLEVGQRLRPDLTNSKPDQKRAKDEIELEMRLLSTIRQVIEHSAGSLTLTDFDSSRQGLIEIDDDYQRLRQTRPDVATRVRDAQLAGLIAGVDYRRLREVDESLLDGYVVPAMQEQTTLKEFAEALTSAEHGNREAASTTGPTGLDVLEDETTPMPGRASLSAIYDMLAKTPQEADVAVPTADGKTTTLPRRTLAAAVKNALESAISAKRRDERKLDALTAPVQYLKEAAKGIDDARLAWLDAKPNPGFAGDAFRSAIEEVKRAYDELDEALADDG
jgi:hypothetical protein